MNPAANTTLDDVLLADCQALAAFRYQLRRFLAVSGDLTRRAGLAPQQHQLMLALRGVCASQTPTVRLIAEWLQIRQHSAGELVDRLVAKGLVVRTGDPADRRHVLIALTPEGQDRLAPLVRPALQALADSGPDLMQALSDVIAHATRHASG